jgi:hypothetical protein
MVLKTFNVSEEAYGKFSKFCKESGVSMSKQVDTFMRAFIEKEPEVRKEYLERLERVRGGRFIEIKSGNLMERYRDK